MLIITRKIKDFLNKKGISQNELARKLDLSSGAFSSILLGDNPFPKDRIEKASQILEVSKEEIQGWILADKYSKETLELALKLKKEKSLDDNKLILTIKIDSILQSKGMSRTALSKAINYSQGGLNEMIIGKEPLSKGCIKKISGFFELPEDEIRAWILADKYSLNTLEISYNLSIVE